MTFAHLHLLLNHFPVIGTIIGAGLLVIALVERNDHMARAGHVVFVAMAILAIPTFMSGIGAQIVLRKAGVPDALIQRHEGSAMLSLWFILITGALAIAALWKSHAAAAQAAPARGRSNAVLLFALLTIVLMARTGTTGGDLRHPEMWPGQSAVAEVSEGPIGSVLAAIEPTPKKFSTAMVFTKWMTAFMMDLHFIGLVLIVGTVGVLDLRIMGVGKQMPIAPLHRLLPWGLLGLALNIMTGLLVFIGAPEDYTFNLVLWLKVAALLLVALNAAAFYLTGVFDRVERVGAGEDAPASAKVLAATALVLWFLVITLGRYIQVYPGSIPTPLN